MSNWLSIEILDGPYAARQWADTHGDALTEAAISGDALDWHMGRTAWGVVFEVQFKTEADLERFKLTDAVQDAIRTAPDPRTGVIIYRGRSSDTGNQSTRKPKPKIGSGAAALPLPIKTAPFVEPLGALFSDVLSDRRPLTSKN